MFNASVINASDHFNQLQDYRSLVSLKKYVPVQCPTQQICFKKACSPRQTSQCSCQPGFLPMSQQVTVHWKCKRSFSYETVNVRQVRITRQQPCFPAKSSCTYLGNLLVYLPVLHNKRKLIIFQQTSGRAIITKKIHTMQQRSHVQTSHFEVFLHRNILTFSSLLKFLMTIPQKTNWPILYFLFIYIRF